MRDLMSQEMTLLHGLGTLSGRYLSSYLALDLLVEQSKRMDKDEKELAREFLFRPHGPQKQPFMQFVLHDFKTFTDDYIAFFQTYKDVVRVQSAPSIFKQCQHSVVYVAKKFRSAVGASITAFFHRFQRLGRWWRDKSHREDYEADHLLGEAESNASTQSIDESNEGSTGGFDLGLEHDLAELMSFSCWLEDQLNLCTQEHRSRADEDCILESLRERTCLHLQFCDASQMTALLRAMQDTLVKIHQNSLETTMDSGSESFSSRTSNSWFGI